MKKYLVLLISLIGTLCILGFLFLNPKKLKSRNWEPSVKEALNKMISESKNTGAYAVFDFDNTTLIGDIEINTVLFQIENLRFKIKPEEIFEILTTGIGDIDIVYKVGNEGRASMRMLAMDVNESYKYLYDNYIGLYTDKTHKDAVKALRKISKTDEYKSFTTKLWALSYCIYENCDYATGCLWLENLFNGMTKNELSELTKDALAFAFSKKKLYRETWEAPKTGVSGSISIDLERGLGISKEMLELYKVLRNNKIETYICSASDEVIVEALACNPEYRLNISPENVFGLRMEMSQDSTISAVFKSGYIQTFKEGKELAIREYMSPNHDNGDPVLVAGDSNGDYEMLTNFKNLKIGLIINCNNRGKIGELTERALKQSRSTDNEGPLYLVQGRDPSKMKFIPSHESYPIE